VYLSAALRICEFFGCAPGRGKWRARRDLEGGRASSQLTRIEACHSGHPICRDEPDSQVTDSWSNQTSRVPIQVRLGNTLYSSDVSSKLRGCGSFSMHGNNFLRSIRRRSSGTDPRTSRSKRKLVKLQLPGIAFRGRLRRAGVIETVKGARFMIVPSTWYEGFSDVDCRVLCMRNPVRCSGLRRFGEIVEDHLTGLEFHYGDPPRPGLQGRVGLESSCGALGDGARPAASMKPIAPPRITILSSCDLSTGAGYPRHALCDESSFGRRAAGTRKSRFGGRFMIGISAPRLRRINLPVIHPRLRRERTGASS
jgi:hypothetical protein